MSLSLRGKLMAYFFFFFAAAAAYTVPGRQQAALSPEIFVTELYIIPGNIRDCVCVCARAHARMVGGGG